MDQSHSRTRGLDAIRRGLKFRVLALSGLLALTSVGLLVPSGAKQRGQETPSDEIRLSSRPYRPGLLHAESVEIEVGVVVRDEKGLVITGLKPEDFSVYDDGKKQQLSGFNILNRTLRTGINPQSAPPAPTAESDLQPPPGAPAAQASLKSRRARYVALFFDDFHIKSGDIRHVQIASQEFIRNGLSTDDSVGVFTASGSPNLDFTPDAAKALDAVSKLTSHLKVFENSSCPRMTEHDAYLIDNNLDPDAFRTALGLAIKCNCDDVANFEQLCYQMQESVVRGLAREVWAPARATSYSTLDSLRSVLSHLGNMPGDRVLLVASSGFFAGGLESPVDQIVSDALRSGIVVNAIDAKGLFPEYKNPAERVQSESCALCPASMARLRHESEAFGPDLMFSVAPMTAFAIGTGGQFFHNRNDLTAGYYSLGVAPETEYLLGFSPDKGRLNGAFHRLKVEVSAPGKFEVQARPGYFASARESSGPTAEERIDKEVRGSEERSDFPLSVSERDQTENNGDRKLNVEMRVDIQKLPFKKQKERHIDMLTFVAALFDTQGKLVTGEEAQTQLALRPDTFERLSKTGLTVVTSLKAPLGAYGLRIVVEEAMQGRLSATSKEVQIR